MENYIVSARKYRPATFESVVGQRSLTTTLKNAIARQKLAHAYLFCGPHGVGKTTCARIFARTINCLNVAPTGEACDECESCRAFNEQRSYNIHELDAASNNSVDDIRTLVEQVRIPPQIGKYKVYIIDEVHMLSTAAFNAFLKTLEEPPRYAIFVLATTEKHKILPTILSRCQIYDFSRISVSDMVDHLAHVAAQEGIQAEPEGLTVIAQKADGGLRDALSIFDQVASFTGGNISYKNVIENLNVLDYEYYFRLTDYFLEGKVTESLLLFDQVLKSGFDGNQFITGLSSHFRDLLVSRDESTLPLLEVGAAIRQQYRTQAQKCLPAFLYKAIKLANECDLNYRVSRNKRLLVELTLIRLAQLVEDDTEGSGRSPQPAIKPIASSHPAQPQASVAPIPQQPTVQQPVQAAGAPVNPAVQARTTTTTAALQVAPSQTPPVHSNTDIQELLQARPEKKIPVMQAGSMGVSIKGPRKEAQVQEKKAEKIINTAAQEDFIFNEKDLNFYWKEYAMTLPLEHRAFAARMLHVNVKLLDDACFEMVVENELIAKEMTSMIAPVQNYLRERLNNRKITMKIRVSEPQEQVRAYSKVEKFQAMAEKNPDLLKLREEFGLEFY
ncbi:MAG: DNA polymerase III subunit gamma/tau [Bacteroides sp.]|nr:DNA polymerase III subunit gamma/tau [Bacteroides sp.]